MVDSCLRKKMHEAGDLGLLGGATHLLGIEAGAELGEIVRAVLGNHAVYPVRL